jgi:uncharacterized protein
MHNIMRRWVMAQTLLCTALKYRPPIIIIPVYSIPSPLPEQQHRRHNNMSLTERPCHHHVSEITTKIMLTTSSYEFQFFRLGSTNNTTYRTFVALRGGGSCDEKKNITNDNDDVSSRNNSGSVNSKYTVKSKYTVLSDPAPGSPFHYAFPVHNLQLAKEFYGTVLGCVEGRSSTKWQDYSLHGHQIVAHWVGNDYRCQDYYNPVDGDEVPVPRTFHKFNFITFLNVPNGTNTQESTFWINLLIFFIYFGPIFVIDTGLALTVDQFHELANQVRNAGVPFIIEPHLRFKGMPGEQYTMFFKDPSGTFRFT